MCFVPQRRALFRHLNFQKWSEPLLFLTFGLRNVLRATTACNFSSLIWPDGSAPAALRAYFSTLRSHKSLEKTECFATFPPFRAPASSFFWLFLFSDLLSSTLLFSLTLPISAFHLSILSEVWLLKFLRTSNAHWIPFIWTWAHKKYTVFCWLSSTLLTGHAHYSWHSSPPWPGARFLHLRANIDILRLSHRVPWSSENDNLCSPKSIRTRASLRNKTGLDMYWLPLSMIVLLDFSILSIGKLLKGPDKTLTLCCKWQDISNQQPSRTMPECLFTSLLPIARVTSCQILSLPSAKSLPSRSYRGSAPLLPTKWRSKGLAHHVRRRVPGREHLESERKQLSIGEINWRSDRIMVIWCNMIMRTEMIAW